MEFDFLKDVFKEIQCLPENLVFVLLQLLYSSTSEMCFKGKWQCCEGYELDYTLRKAESSKNQREGVQDKFRLLTLQVRVLLSPY